jgi:hypothetical protein
MTLLSGRQLILGVALLLCGASLAGAQGPCTGGRGAPMYDPKSETTIKGIVDTVESVAQPSGGGRRCLGGTHLVVKTENETFQVHLGPTAYLSEQKIAIAKGDAVEILGSRVTIDQEPVVLARQITKGGTMSTLRDPSGRPLWSGRRK